MKAKRETLANAPKYRRLSALSGGAPTVDRRGGYRKEGMIRGASVVTRGEALGHGLWLDDDFVNSVHSAMSARNKGVKSRFTHPGLSADGLATHLGRAMSPVREGEQVYADFHFTASSHKTPDGDLSGYVMDMADESPEDIAISIVYDPDLDAERDHFEANGGKVVADEFGEFWDDTNFRSPDPLNSQNLPHARLSDLQAADFVGDPAANPDGLFGREAAFASEADALAEFALGLSSRKPEAVALGLDADRVQSFTRRFLSRHKLEIRKMQADQNPTAPAPIDPTQQPAATPDPNANPADPTATPEPAPTAATAADPAALSNVRADAKAYLDAFGQQGAIWFVEGRSMESCYALQNAAQADQIKTLNDRLAGLEKRLSVGVLTGEPAPVPFQSGEGNKRLGFASRIRFATVTTEKN